jgi:hypothetical protein
MKTLGLVIVAALASGCASREAARVAPGEGPRGAETAPSASQASEQPAAAAGAAAQAPVDFTWPDPLPPSAAEARPLFKGLVIGSWAPEGDAGFDHDWVGEASLQEAWTRQTVSRRAWKGFTAGDATVRMDSLLNDRQGPAVGYLFSLIARTGGGDDPDDQAAVLHLRHRGRLRAWLDGVVVFDLPAPPAGTWGEARAPVVLSGPYDVLLFKLGRGSETLGPSMEVEARVSAPDGSPLPAQTWNSMRPGVAPTGAPASEPVSAPAGG